MKNQSKKTVLAIAPHPDDETLGCGGTLLRHQQHGDAVHWLIVTAMSEKSGFTPEQMTRRSQEIKTVARLYGFQGVHELNLPTVRLDTLPLADVVAQFKKVFETVRPQVVYVPFRGDVHSDHGVVFDAAAACTKAFRAPYVEKILAYETLSETEFAINPGQPAFHPNVFVSIEPFLDKKLEILRTFESELKPFPFPRSEECVRALAALRGSTAGLKAAEAFMALREICQ